MLTLCSTIKYYKLEYTNRKGEKIEADIECGQTSYPSENEWSEISVITILEKNTPMFNWKRETINLTSMRKRLGNSLIEKETETLER